MAERGYVSRPRPTSSASAPIAKDVVDRAAAVTDVVRKSADTLGRPLDPATREYMEPRFGHDFSRVRIHTDESASTLAGAIGTPAYTVGRDIIFGADRYAPQTGGGRQLLAHELAHVVQQADSVAFGRGEALAYGAPPAAELEAVAASRAVLDGAVAGAPSFRTGCQPVLQRYEAGEHAQFGEAGDALKELVDKKAFQYKVKQGEMPGTIAARYGVTEEDLRAANGGKLRTWKATSGAGTVQGFNAGETILIPPAVNAAVKGALQTKELRFAINGATVDYGQGIAMGDLFKDPRDMLAATDATLTELQKLIEKDKAGPAGVVTAKEWDDATGPATGGKYSELALKNEAHFAPSSPALAPVSGKSSDDHKSSWEKYHALAISESQAGNKDKALALNAFADHFLTDAFAAGHLFNKRDVMELFNSKLPVNAKKEFTTDSKAFFDRVAAHAFTGSVKTEFSQYETVATTYWMHWRINSVSRFSELLQQIHSKEPDVLSGAVTKAVHDTLNQEPSGVSVENNMGDKWNLSGDKSLNADSLKIGRKAVAQSELNVLSAFKATGHVDLSAAYKSVWDYVPHPTPVGEATVKKETASGTDPKSAPLIDAVAGMIRDNYRLILNELVSRGFLRKA